MANKPHPMAKLADFLPPDTFEMVIPYIEQHPLKLVINKPRKRIAGNYQRPYGTERAHKITVNGNLPPFEFLEVLLHELAHMHTYIQYQDMVAPHGEEWKAKFKLLLDQFLLAKVWPADIAKALIKHTQNIKASSCRDAELVEAFRKYRGKHAHLHLVKDIGVGNRFKTQQGEIFIVEKKMRTRFNCTKILDGLSYSFPALMEVELAND